MSTIDHTKDPFKGVKGIISAGNSSAATLASAATFTGTAELNDYPDVLIQVATDQNGTLYAEFSSDGTNWDTSLSFAYDTARINPPHIFVKGSRYFRVRFTNDSASAQTYFRLTTSYGIFQKLTSPINGTVAENYDATLVRPTEYKYEVAMSKRQGRSTWNKFGYNSDIDTASAEVIAEFGGTFNIMTSADTLDVVSSDVDDDGVGGGAGARQIAIIGIDANSDPITEIVTTNGTTTVTTTNSFLGVNRAYVISSGTSDANEGTITIDDTSGTVGTQATIPAGESVTQQAIFHTPINNTFLVDWLRINVNKISGGSSPRVTIKGYSYSRVVDCVYEIFRETIDTDVENNIELNPSQPFVITGREVLYFVAETNTNNTQVTMRFSGILERNS